MGADHSARALVLQAEAGRVTIVGTRFQLAEIAGAIAQAIARGDGAVLIDGRPFTLRCWDPISPPSLRDAFADEELPQRSRDPVTPRPPLVEQHRRAQEDDSLRLREDARHQAEFERRVARGGT